MKGFTWGTVWLIAGKLLGPRHSGGPGPNGKGGAAGVADSAFEPINLFTGDNFHLTAAGYCKIATSIVSGIEQVVRKQLESECVVTGELKNFYWRGFVSHKGSSRPKPTQHSMKMRGRGGWGGPGRGGQGGHRHHHHNYPNGR